MLGNRIQRQIDDDDHSNKVRRELVTGTVNHWPKFGDKVHVSYTIDGIGNVRCRCYTEHFISVSHLLNYNCIFSSDVQGFTSE